MAPPSAIETCVISVAELPSWLVPETAEGWSNCVMVDAPVVALYRFQFKFRSLAPSASPVIAHGNLTRSGRRFQIPVGIKGEGSRGD